MPKRLLAAVLACLPTLAFAQGAAPNGPLCDGSEIRHAVQRRHAGQALVEATAVADLVAMLTIPRNPGGAEKARSHFAVVAATAPVALAGLFIAGRASPGEAFWERILARLKVGETTSSDVRLCLQRPEVKTSSGTEERWTYVTTRPSGLLASSMRSVQLTFRDSVLSAVLTKEVAHSAIAAARIDSADHLLDRHHGFCAPPIPAVADAFPTPADTTAAAAAMARAQADAEAASKTAAAFAAYASCMASDSAR
jgi:hypothetical protein